MRVARMSKPPEETVLFDSGSTAAGWRKVALGLSIYYWAWILTFAFFAAGKTAAMAETGFRAPPQSSQAVVSKTLAAIGPLGHRGCWFIGVYGLWLCCSVPRKANARRRVWLALTLSSVSLAASALLLGTRLVGGWTPLLEAIDELQVVWRVLGVISPLLVLAFLDKVDRALDGPSGKPARTLRAAGPRGYPSILGIGAVGLSITVVTFYIPALLAETLAGGGHDVGWVFWEDVCKRLSGCVMFLLFLFRVRDGRLSVQLAVGNPPAGPPTQRFRRRRITALVLGVFLMVSIGESWLRHYVWTAENAIRVARAGDFDGAVRTAERVRPYEPDSRFSPRVRTVVCSACHEPSFTDTARQADTRAELLAAIARLQAEAGRDDFSSLIAAAKRLDRASSRADALAAVAQARAHRPQR